MRARGIRVAAAAALVLLMSGCAAGGDAAGSGSAASALSVRPASSPPASSRPAASRAAPTRAATVRPSLEQRAAAAVRSMSRSERAGQLLMTAGTLAQLPSLAGSVRRYHLGGVMIRGRSAAGTAAVSRAFRTVQAAAPKGLPLLTSTDQEGGLVQVLSGPGFTTIPSAVVQGGRSTTALQRDATGWGRALAKAGVRLDLAPVADVPCAADLHDNPPVAALRRQYGTDPAAAGRHVAAFVRGMRSAGVATAVKHFPGLGCVTRNTDVSAHVVDTSTTATSARLQAFRRGIAAQPGFVMVSSAEYARIDRGVPALFSTRIVTGLLRDRLGFDGVVMSDDVGAAVAVQAWTPAQRAVRFVAAGGDLLLDVVPAHVAAEHAALVDRAARDAVFDRTLTAAATRVVAARLRVASNG